MPKRIRKEKETDTRLVSVRYGWLWPECAGDFEFFVQVIVDSPVKRDSLATADLLQKNIGRDRRYFHHAGIRIHSRPFIHKETYFKT